MVYHHYVTRSISHEFLFFLYGLRCRFFLLYLSSAANTIAMEWYEIDADNRKT